MRASRTGWSRLSSLEEIALPYVLIGISFLVLAVLGIIALFMAGDGTDTSSEDDMSEDD